MLCLKAEALEEDHRIHPQSLDSNCSDESGDCNGGNSGGFVLPIKWASSINRYLQWKSGKVWSRSFLAPDDSSSELEEDAKPQEMSGQEKSKQMCHYRHQLEEEVKKLQQQLQEETDLHLALASAVEHSGSHSPNSPSKLPYKALELLDSIAVLEISVSKLEQEILSLQYQLSQERNERRLAEYHLKHSPCPTTLLFNCSLAHLTEPITTPCNEEEAEENVDDVCLSEAAIDNIYIVENLWHHPNQLSEEMVLRMRDIFLFLADSSKLYSSDHLVSPASPHCPLANFLASFSDSPIVTSLVKSPSVGGASDPYGVSGQVDWKCNIGTYSTAVEVSCLSVGKKELEYATMALKRFRLLVEQLAEVDPSQMSCNEKLACLAYGVPRNINKLFSLMQKASYIVGGLSVSAADIECTILKMNPATYRPQIAAAVALQKFNSSNEQKKYTVDHAEPLLYFALSCGLHSSPAVRIFSPQNVNELLKRSMKDYIQATVGISNKGKVLVPKLLHCFAKGVIEDSLLPDWICRFLTPQQASMVKDCLSRNKWKLLGARSFCVLPFDSRFRFLFLLDDDGNSLSSTS
ncbi:hypothetical protein ERO13_D05G038700v2 [Gossypium hirsutum]|uniref:DUF547 domain-containing protein n=1 Tax=Gossypium barbadense TaxID=3634 RepID=A0A5J5N860_GOSBA|nr:hypothetical protein ES319_1Z079900v1 [Gossypium barbadense]KAB1671081.1 hypothetical protein [Gossypium barbadense]KAG4144465.1 hypothetical protein ERO13_D05G038700v2 [Gossypium hirsutum]